MDRRPAAVVFACFVLAVGLAACSDGDGERPALSTSSSITVTTGTRPPRTSTTEATTTTEPATSTTRRPITTTTASTTTAPTTTATTTTAPTTTAPTTTEPATSTTAPATTTAPTTTAPSTTAAPPTSQEAAPTTLAPGTSEPDDESTGAGIWIALALVALVVTTVLLVTRSRNRKAAASTWGHASGRAAATGTRLAGEIGGGDVAGDTEPAVLRQLQSLDAELEALQTGAPTSLQREAVTAMRGAVGGLGAALDADVRLRIGPPPPTEDQLATSRAVVAQRAGDLGLASSRLDQAVSPV